MNMVTIHMKIQKMRIYNLWKKVTSVKKGLEQITEFLHHKNQEHKEVQMETYWRKVYYQPKVIKNPGYFE